MTATLLHFPNPLAKAIACIEHGFYWAIQAYAADRYQRLIAADGYARHREFTGQGRG